MRHERELQVARLYHLGVAPPPRDLPYNMLPTEADLHRDRIALHQWQNEASVASAIPDPPWDSPYRLRRGAPETPRYTTPLNLPRALPTDHAADIYFGFSQPIGVGPVKHGLVPLSYLGPSGTSIVALSNKHVPLSLLLRDSRRATLR